MTVNAVNPSGAATPPDRRQRQRDATTAEIREVARRQLAVTGAAGLSLRAVAREMGLTAPALYRYYDDRDALLTALIVDGYTSLCEQLEAARDAAPDAAGQIAGMSLAYRRWAVTHPHEFALVFGAPVPGYAAPEDGPTHEAGMRFGAAFLDVFAAGARRDRLRAAARRAPHARTRRRAVGLEGRPVARCRRVRCRSSCRAGRGCTG